MDVHNVAPQPYETQLFLSVFLWRKFALTTLITEPRPSVGMALQSSSNNYTPADDPLRVRDLENISRTWIVSEKFFAD